MVWKWFTRRKSPSVGIPKPTFDSFIGPRSLAQWFVNGEQALKRLRKVKGFEAAVRSRAGAESRIDLTARDESQARDIVWDLGFECDSIARFKGVIRGSGVPVDDESELRELAMNAQALLKSESEKGVIRPGERGSEWEGFVHTEAELRAESILRAVRFGINTYLCVIRFRRESFAVERHGTNRGKRVHGAGGSINHFDQRMGIAGGILVLNAGVSAEDSV